MCLHFHSFSQMFFPYDARYMRCHPAIYGICDGQQVDNLLTCGSNKMKYQFKCSECDNTYFSTFM